MWPVLFKIGPLAVHAYGLMLAIAFVAGIQLALAEGRRRGLPEDRLASLALWMLVASIVGARLIYVATHVESFSGPRVLAAFRIWEGGLTMYGGLLAALLVAYVATRRWHLPVATVFDAFAPSVALGEGLTRIGCFLNGCCFGTPCTLPWAVTFPATSHAGTVYPGQSLHPSQLYLSAAGFGIFAVLWLARRRIRTPGRLFFVFLLLASIARFSIDWVRHYEPGGEVVRLAGLTLSLTQFLCLFLIVGAVIGLMRRPLPATAVSEPVGAHAHEHDD